MPDVDFAPAADRHLHDAALLLEHGRLPNADHVAGYAAECFVKVVAVRFLGATLTASGKPQLPGRDPRSTPKAIGHIDEAWNVVRTALAGRQTEAFAPLLDANPFQEWRPADRYLPGDHIDRTRVSRHLAYARQLQHMVAEARVSGLLT